MLYRNRLWYLLKERLKLPLVTFYYTFIFLMMSVCAYVSYPQAGVNAFWILLVPFVLFFLFIGIPIFIEAKYYLLEVSEQDGFVSFKYLKYNKEQTFEAPWEQLRYKVIPEQSRGTVIDEAIVIGVRTRNSYFKTIQKFYCYGSLPSDKSYKDMLSDLSIKKVGVWA